jgi:uncharacterized repeat protein (TIGR01451 family)
MNLANHTAPVAGPPDETPYARTTAAGGYVDFPLLVQNTAPAAASPGNPAGSPDVYTLSSSVLPAGWRVVFYADPDRDGVVDSGELLPVLRTPEIAPAGRAYVVARVFVPAGTSGDADANPANGRQDYTLTFRAASTNLPAVFDDQVDFVRVGYDDRFELRPDRQGTIEPGGTVQYLHTVRNLGERANRFYLTFTPGRSDWTYTLINADGSALLPTAIDPADGLEKAYVDLTGAAGATPKVDFQLRLFAPARTPLGQTETTFLQVSANDPDAPATPLPVEDLHGVVDVTRVVRGDLVLTKTVDPAENIPVSPGDVLTYTTRFFNRGTGSVTEVRILDAIPARTTYRRGSGTLDPPPGYAGGHVFEVSRNGGVSWTTDTGAGPDATVTNVRMRLLAPLLPGLTGAYTFEVLVK